MDSPGWLRIDALNTATPNLEDEPSSANDPQYQSRDDLHTTAQILADEPTLADGPPSTRAEMTCIPLYKTWQMNLLWLMDPPVPEQRWLAYHYTKLGRWTYFGQWTPKYQSRDDLHTTTQILADEPTLADGPPSTRAEMTCIPLYKTWQMNLLWLMDPQVPEQRWLAYHYTKLGRWTYFGQWTPKYQSRDDLHTTTQNLADEPTLANGPPQYHSRDDLHTTIQNLADKPTLANGPPQYHSRDDLHTTTQNLADEPTLADGPPIPEQRWLAYHYTKLGRWTYFGQWTPKYQSRDDLHTTTQNLADEPTVAEHNGKGFKALAFTISEITHSIFSKHIFA